MTIRTPADGSRRSGLALVGICLFVAFSIGYGNFLHSSNLDTIALSSASVLIASIGMMALLVSGNVDLSIGSQYALVSVVTAIVVLHTGSVVLGVVTALAVGATLGLINGLLVLLLRVSPLIVTLATLGIYSGFAYVASGGVSVFGLPDSFTEIGSARVLGVPAPAVIAVCVFAAGALVLVTTVTGLRLYAIGSNHRASALLGVRRGRLVACTFAANGALVGLVALLSTSQLASGSPQIGVNFELNVLAAVILGGVSFSGGRGHPLGVFVSVATLGVLETGLIFAGMADWWQQIAQGALLLSALAADQLLVARRARRVRQGFEPPPAVRGTPAPARRERLGSGQAGIVLDVSDLTVRFAGVLALDRVSLSARAGEIVCLVGDNGAGKSTLAKVIAGAARPAAGEVRVDGRLLSRGCGVSARRAGVETVFQEQALCPDLSVSDNLALGEEPRHRLAGVLPIRDVKAADLTARNRLDELGVSLTDVRKPVRLLSGGERQIVQILRVMRPGVRLVVLDEPTSALGLSQAAEVRALARAIADAGTPVLMITHDVEEVFELADRVVVLERGQLVFNGPVTSVNRLELLRMMSGKSRVEAERIIEAVSSERRRIERDLHDGAQQGLVQAALTLGLAKDQLRRTGNEDLAEMLGGSIDTVKTALNELRDLSRGLYPALLAQEGLISAVEAVAARCAVPTRLRCDRMPRLGEQLELAAYFVIAEALTNVVKHAMATRAEVSLGYDGHWLSVVVSDDGCGEVDESAGSGLRGLRDRVATVGGTLHVSSGTESDAVAARLPGTTVAAVLPLDVTADPRDQPVAV